MIERGNCPFCNRKGHGFISNYPSYGQYTCELCYYTKIHWFGHAWRLVWRTVKGKTQLNTKEGIKMFVYWFIYRYLRYKK